MKLVFGKSDITDGVIYLLPTIRLWLGNGYSKGIDFTWLSLSLFVGVEK